MKEIRTVVRNGLPETNSSSTHSLVISDEPFNYDARTSNLRVDPDGVLRLMNTIGSFGWGWEKYNDSYTKALYVAAFADNDPNIKKLLVKALKDVTGAKSVEFSWNKKGGLDSDAPTIDHQSYQDMFILICETSDTIKDFIFNDKSWLFTGNDNSEEPDGFREIEEDPNKKKPIKGLMTIHFTDSIDFCISLSDLSNKYKLSWEVATALSEWISVDADGNVTRDKVFDQEDELSWFDRIDGDEIVFLSRKLWKYRDEFVDDDEWAEILEKKVKENDPNLIFRFKYTVETDEFGTL